MTSLKNDSRGVLCAAALAAAAAVGGFGCGGMGNDAATTPPPGPGTAGDGGGGDPPATGAGGDTGTTPVTTDLSQRPQPAVALVDATLVHDIQLTMDPAEWQSIIDDPPDRADEWRHATVVYDGVTVDDVGVRPSGEASRFPGNAKMSIRIKFDAFSGRGKFGGFKEVNVKGEYDDQSMMRERLALFVYRSMMPAPAAAHARLTVNGDLRGLFTIREVWDSVSLKGHFSEPIGPLYRLRPPSGVDPYLFLGTAPSFYVPYNWEPHVTNAAAGDDVIGSFLNVLNTTPAMVDQVVDMNDLVSYLACGALIMNTDGFVGDSGVEDHFQYYDPQTGKFFILPWDPDNTFGSLGEMPTRGIYSHFSTSKLALAVRDAGDFRARYKAKLAEAMTTVPVTAVQAQADSIYLQIRQAAYEDPIKSFDDATFDYNLGYLKDFAARRYTNVQDQLATGP